MQVSSFMTDFIEFKDEILKKIREMETKFFNELSKRNFAININYENFSEKVNSILESNKLMISSITNQKLNIDKIKKLELDIQKIDDTLIILSTKSFLLFCNSTTLCSIEFSAISLMTSTVLV